MGACNYSLRSAFHEDAKILDGLSLSGSNPLYPFLGLSGDQASSFFTRPAVPSPPPTSDPARGKSPADARRA